MRPFVSTASLVVIVACSAMAAHADSNPADAAPELSEGPVGLEPRIRAWTWGGGRIERTTWRWMGHDVVGAARTRFVLPDGRIHRTVDNPVRVAPFSAVPSIDAGRAGRIAADAFADEWGLVGTTTGPTSLEVWTRGGHGTLAWAQSVRSDDGQVGHRMWIDAHDGRLLGSRPDLFQAAARIYPTNPEASSLEEVELDSIPERLWNEYATVSSCAEWLDDKWICEEKEYQASADPDGAFYYEPAPMSLDDPFAEVQMFYHIDVAARYFEEEFDFRADYGQGPAPVEGIVNFPLQNAFFGDADADGRPEIAFGQGGGVDFAYDADVIYHEFGHGVFGQVVDATGGRYDNYGRLVAPYGLNEGTADLLSLVLTGDPLLGEYAGSGPLGGTAIRDLGPDRICPVAVYGESHEDGMLWAALGWNLIEDPAVGARVTAHLVMGALASWPAEGVDWTLAGNSLVDSADTLLEAAFIDAAQHARILEIVGAAGFIDCTRWVPLDHDQEPKQIITARIGQDGTPRTPPLANPFSLDAPAGTTELRFYVEEYETGEADMGWKVYLRRGEPVWFDLVEGQNGRVSAVPELFDLVFDGSGVGKVVELNATSDPPLEVGATYHFAVTADIDDDFEGWGFGEITVRGEIDWGVPPPPAEEDVQGDGCSGCGTGASALLPFMPWGFRRRRRR